MDEEPIATAPPKNLDKLLTTQANIENGQNSNILESKTSYKVALTQALKSSDSDSLKTILSEKDEAIIRQTLLDLQPKTIISLIGAVIDRLESYPAESNNLLKWLKHILRENLSTLSANPDNILRLKYALRVLSLKEGSMMGLIGLKGKLDFVLGEKAKLKSKSKDNNNQILDMKPMILYEEGILFF